MFAQFLKKMVCCSVALFIAFAAHANSLNSIVAVVNDQAITNGDLQQTISAMTAEQAAQTGKKLSPAEIRKQALDQLIDRDLQLQVAKLAKVTVSDDQFNAALADIAKQHQLTVAQLPAAIAKEGISYDKFTKQLRDQLTIQNFQQQQLSGTVIITPKEIDALAKKLATQPATAQPAQMQYHFIDILIALPAQPTESDMNQAKSTFDSITTQINQGKDFSTVSQNVLGTPAKDLGWRGPDQLPPGFLAIAAKMSIGQITQPIRTPEGIHILKLIDKKNVAPGSAMSNDITETHVRHILLKKDALTPDSTLQRRLVSLRDEIINGGADFATVAEANSQDPGSVANGGDLGWVKPDTLDPKFETAMNKLKVNEISQPVQTSFGWHLIQVLGRKQIQDRAAALKIQAQQILFQQKMQDAVKQMISQLRAQAYIKIM